MAKFDTALDDIVKANKSNRRSTGKNRGGSGSPRKNRATTMPTGRRTNRGGSFGGASFRARSALNRSRSIENARRADDGVTRLSVRNLDYAVNDKDLRELFNEFGGLRRSEVHYDRDGRSQGSAELVFMSKRNAIAAKKQYNGVPLDGRPMEIDIIGDRFVPELIRAALKDRRDKSRGGNRGGNRGGPRRQRNANSGGGGGGGAGGAKKEKKEEKTAEELDKELDNYLTAGAGTA